MQTRSVPRILLAAASLCLITRWAAAYPTFATRLPNGNSVRSPCNPSEVWPGVGHFSQAGGNTRNPFGVDFKEAGFKWTPELCRKDSDGDGKTNGEELGDPDCVWQPGANPGRTTDITHPGICEPVGSDKCHKLNGHFQCAEKFNCSAINQPGVRKMSMQMKKTRVPAKETTYMCQAFEVSSLPKEHMIAAVPIIDNPNVLHHMIIYGCNTKPNINLNEPIECGMGAAGCINLIDLWGLGMRNGNCYRDNTGAPFGLQGYQYVVLQLHWNNPAGVTTWEDASGFELYFSPTLRQYDTGVMMYGQMKLDLAPRQTEIYRTSTCDARCTKATLPPTGYKLLWGTLHMHNYGIRGQVTLWRDGKKVRDLVPMHKFDYDTPLVFEYNPPVDYLPGDEIKTDCYFSTSKTNRSVYWGESTQEEMCYVFLQYFPHNKTRTQIWPNADQCTSFGKVDYCTAFVPNLDTYVVDGCDIKSVQNRKLLDKHIAEVSSECHNSHMFRCSDQCLIWYRKVKKTEPCFQGDVFDYVAVGGRGGHNNLRAVMTYLDLCAERDQRELLRDAQEKLDELSKRPPPTPHPPTDGSHGLLTNDVRLLIVSGSYLAGLLFAAALVLVIYKMKRSSPNRVEDLSTRSSTSKI